MVSPSLIQTAMLLAAGFGTRMQEYTTHLPKPLLPIGDHTLLDFHLQALKTAGFRKVVINLHYHGNLIREYVEKQDNAPLQVFFSEEKEILGTGGGIALAEKYFRGETILVINSDVISDINLQELVSFHQRSSAFTTLAGWPSSNSRDYSLLQFDANGHLHGFLKKNTRVESGDLTAIYTGYQILTPGARHYLKPEFSSVIDRLYLPALLDRQKIMVYLHRGVWLDIGTKENYREVSQKIKNKDILRNF